MSYKVQSRTTLEQYKKKENEVIRRFRDFAWLHSKLQEQNRGKLFAGHQSCSSSFMLNMIFTSHCGEQNLRTGSCAGIIIPPLPEKNVVQKYQMTAEFIEQRRKALQVYVNRVVSLLHQQIQARSAA